MFISWGELALLGGVGLLLYGPKDLPRIARMGGQYAGKFMVFVRKTRSGMDSFATQNELLHLQQDVRRGLMELNSIRGEIQEGLTVVPKMYGTAPLPAAMPRGQQVPAIHRSAPATANFPTFPGHAPPSRTPEARQAHNLDSSGVSVGAVASGGGIIGGMAARIAEGRETRTGVEGGHAEPVGGVGCAEKGAHGAREEAAIAGTGVGAGGFAAASEGMRSVLQDSREGSGGIVWGPPSSEEAVMFEPRTDTMSGGADHIMEYLHLRQRLAPREPESTPGC